MVRTETGLSIHADAEGGLTHFWVSEYRRIGAARVPRLTGLHVGVPGHAPFPGARVSRTGPRVLAEEVPGIAATVMNRAAAVRQAAAAARRWAGMPRQEAERA
jgi:hypothetical protein